MINQGTVLRVIDNSGARYALCIKVLGKRNRVPAKLGDKVMVVVKIITPDKKVKKSEIHLALIVRNSKQLFRSTGTYIRFIKPACVILRRDGQPLAKRILGPVCSELRKMGHLKIISISSLAL